MTVVTAVAVHVEIATTEVEAVSDVVVVVVRRRKPIVTVASSEVERRPVTAARSRKEDAVAVRSCYFVSFKIVCVYPFPGTLCV